MAIRRRLKRHLPWVALVLLWHCPAGHAWVRVATTGDSLTVGYSPALLQQSLSDARGDALVCSIAEHGCDAEVFTGHRIEPHTNVYRDFTAEVLRTDPDVIVFMLGANDVVKLRDTPESWPIYVQDITTVFDRMAAAASSRHRHPTVIVLTLLPFVSADPNSALSYANDRINDTYNPWLRQQAAHRGFILLDVNAAIRAVPDWQAFYSDGVHLEANDGAGYAWLAGQVRDAAVAALQAGPGDFDRDRDVDLGDFSHLAGCFNGPNRPPLDANCNDADMDLDGDVDLEDFSALEACFNGPNRPTLCPPPEPIIVTADFDRDGDVDLADFSRFQTCFNGPNRPPAEANCQSVDLDNDNDVDLGDFSLLQACFGGPNRDPACSH